MEFKAEKDSNGVIHVKPIIERKGKDLIIHCPSFPLMNKLKQDYEKENGKRNI